VSWDFRNKKIVLLISPSVEKKIKKIKNRNLLKALHKRLELFQQNPLHNSLRFKKYHFSEGSYWEISITMKYRAILSLEETDDSYIFTMLEFGEHDILKKFNS
jgi:hypothetical protein